MRGWRRKDENCRELDGGIIVEATYSCMTSMMSPFLKFRSGVSVTAASVTDV